MQFKEEYKTMIRKISSADSIDKLNKLESSLTRLYDNGVFTVGQMAELCAKLMICKVNIEHRTYH